MAKKQGDHDMTEHERYKLEAYLRAGKTKTWIAKEMGFCRQTIYNEIARGECNVIREIHGIQRDVKEYSADKGQQVHDYKQTAKGRHLKIGTDRAYADFLERKMLGVQDNGKVDRRKRYSPVAALELARREDFTTSVCVSTLYSYIDKQVFLNLSNKDLWEKGKKKQKQKKVRRSPHPLLPSIVDRPEIINLREELGHKEIDLIVGCEKSKAVVLTITDRASRAELAFKLPDKRAASVRTVFDKLEQEQGSQQFREIFKSITTDNGSEFLEYEELIKSIFGGKRFEVYYCHSYAAYEKGTNENHNRLMRRFFPKGTNFDEVSQEEIQEAADFLNHYPRKILEWKMPAEIA